MKTDARWSRTSFWLGMLFGYGLMMAYQDWLGLDGYCRYVQQHWWNLPWWAGAIIATLAFLGQPLNELLHERS